MFDERQLAEILDLHNKSFALLRWVRESLNQGTVSFSVVHSASDSGEAAFEWIGRHLKNLPGDARPLDNQIPAFARLFASFLTTSYRLNPNSTRLVSAGGCCCMCCSYLKSGPNLDPRTPSKRDFETAKELKRIYLTDLFTSLPAEEARRRIDSILAQPAWKESVAMATWGFELVRRSRFVSQGEAVLALWREFAWQGTSPKRKFKITAAAILSAEKKLITAFGDAEPDGMQNA